MEPLDCGVLVVLRSHSPLDVFKCDTTIGGETFVMMDVLE